MRLFSLSNPLNIYLKAIKENASPQTLYIILFFSWQCKVSRVSFSDNSYSMHLPQPFPRLRMWCDEKLKLLIRRIEPKTLKETNFISFKPWPLGQPIGFNSFPCWLGTTQTMHVKLLIQHWFKVTVSQWLKHAIAEATGGREIWFTALLCCCQR